MTRHWNKDIPDACPAAMKWTRSQPDLATAWKNCKRGDWMMFLLGQVKEKNGRRMVKAVAHCVKKVLPLLNEGDEKSVYSSAVQAVIKWSRKIEISSKIIEESQITINNVYDNNNQISNWYRSKSYYVNNSLTTTISFIEENDNNGDLYKDNLWTAVEDASKVIPQGHGRHWQRARKENLSISADIIRKVFPNPPRLPKRKKEIDYANN